MTVNEMKKLRKRLGYNIASFSRKVGMDRTLLSKIEKGDRQLSEKHIKQINRVLGFHSEKERANLQVQIDYLRLTFFNADVYVIMQDVLGIKPEYFTTEPRKKHNYELWHSCGNIILMSSPDNKQGVLLDLTSDGICQFGGHLDQNGLTLLTWLKQVLDERFYLKHGFYDRVHSTRLDIAIDEMVDHVRGNFDLQTLDDKQRNGLIHTTLRNYHKISASKGDNHNGLTLSWGARGTDRLFLRFYEKRYELAKKYRITVEEALQQHGIYNRYELEIGKEINPYLFERYLDGDSLTNIAIDLLLSKIEVYDEVKLSGEKTACKEWYDIFANWKKIKITTPSQNVSLERSMRWIVHQVVPTLKMLSELLGKQTVLNWLSNTIDHTELKPNQLKQLEYERLLMQSTEESFLYFMKENHKEME